MFIVYMMDEDGEYLLDDYAITLEHAKALAEDLLNEYRYEYGDVQFVIEEEE